MDELLKDYNMRSLCRDLIRYTKMLMKDPEFMAEYEAWKAGRVDNDTSSAAAAAPSTPLFVGSTDISPRRGESSPQGEGFGGKERIV